MFTVVGNYKGVDIFEQYGYYYPSSDTNVESRFLKGIIEYVDRVLHNPDLKKKYSVDADIMANYVETEQYSKN